MAKVVDKKPTGRRPSLRGRFYSYSGKYGDIAASWPPKRGKPKSDAHKATVSKFAAVVQAYKAMPAEFIAALEGVTKGTAFMPRDLWMRMAYGGTQTFLLSNGKRLYSMATRVNMSNLLDNLTDPVGALLTRGEDYWQGIAPSATAGYVLTHGGPGTLPYWAPGGGGGGGSPDFAAPPAANFPTRLNAPTLLDSDRGLGIAYAGSNNTAAACLAAFDTATSLVWTARLLPTLTGSGNNGIYLVARDSGTGKMHGVGYTNNSISQGYAEGTKWTNENTYGSGDGGGAWAIGPLWVKLAYDQATKTLTASRSTDGVNWSQCFADNTYLAAPDQVGFLLSHRSTTYTPVAAITYFAAE